MITGCCSVHGVIPSRTDPPFPAFSARTVHFSSSPSRRTMVMKRIHKLATLVAVAATLNVGLVTRSEAQNQPIELLNASYDPTRELYRAVNSSFTAYWKSQTNQTVIIR